MSPLSELLRDQIRREGTISFRQFMEAALYHPAHGYYRQARDPFGVHGDFYTAEQVQPVFGRLVAARIRAFYQEMGKPQEFTIVEPGAGRGEMAEALTEWRYVPVDIGRGEMPERFCGVVLANEFFDALPVEAAEYRCGSYRELRVGWAERFIVVRGGPVRAEIAGYLDRYFPPAEDGARFEINLDALAWLDRIARALTAGYLLTIDYGYTRADWPRFRHGTLMGYRRHQASEDVLESPGEQDITAHVCFTALEEYGARLGLEVIGRESLAHMLLAAGEADQFASALAAPTSEEQLRHRLQLKNLLFGMGETFRTLQQRAGGGGAGTK